MAAGFKVNGVSNRGRTIKPNSKIRDLMLTSVRKEFSQEIEQSVEIERRISAAVGSNAPTKTLTSLYEAWQQKADEIYESEYEFRKLIPDEELDVHDDKFLNLSKHLTAVREEAEDFLFNQAKLDTKDDYVEQLRKETAVVQKELKEVEAAISRISLASARHTRPGSVSSSEVARDVRRSRGYARPDGDGDHKREEESTVVKVLEKLAGLLEDKQDSRIPWVEPDVFDGNLLHFPDWWSSFESTIERRAKSEQEKLVMLGKYVSGAVKDTIRGYLSLRDDDTAYAKAKSVVLSRYGNKVKVAETFRRKLEAWPVIKRGDTAAILKYSDFLWQCYSAMRNIEYLSNLDSAEENMKMSRKLPDHLQDRWDRVIDSHMYDGPPDFEDLAAEPTGMHPTFHEFCQFVAREARVGNGPRSARADLDIEEKAKPDHKKKQTTLNTHVVPPRTEKPAKPQGPPPIKCYYCREPHMLDKCAPFIQNSTEFKKAFVRERGLCFGCLKKGHTYRDCSVRNLEFMRDYPQNNKKGATTMRTMAGEESSYASTVVPIVLYHRSKPDVRVCTYALMDTQSDSCFVQRGLAEQLGVLSHEEIDLELQTMGNKCKVRSEEIFGLMARGVSEDTAIPLPHCYTRDAIPGSRTAIPDPKLVRAWPHLEEVADNLQPRREDWDIGILLGYNCSDAMIVVESRHKGCGYPFGLRTTLGWTVMGRLEDVERKPEKRQAVTFKTSARVVTSEEMKLVFEHDFATTKDDDEKMSYDDKCFMAKVTAGLKHRKDKHFEMPLPLREEPAELPDNRCAASKRLMILRRKLSKDEQLLGQYAEFMRGLIENGQAEEVPRPEEAPGNRVWYLSHQFVFHPKKPLEIRIVFDGSQEYMGVSLNGMLLTGPDMLNSLVGVLMRFREEKIGVMCDVEKMFHQVYVREEDRDFLRFLWFDEGDLDGPIKTYRMKVHLFGASSSPACANLALKATAEKFAEKYGEDVAAFILHCFYVDDGLTSKAEPKQVLDLVRDSHNLCLEGGFNLRKFACTDRAVMEQIPKELRLADLKNWEAKGGSLPAERSLGLELGLEDDEFVFRVTLTEKPETRRGMLSSLSSVYDPLGLISAALLKGRLILQSLCCRDFGWDDEVPEDVRADWREWHGQLAGLSEIKIPRSCRKTANLPLTRTELHMFSDASTIGYGACAYLLLSDGENIDVTLVYAKSRVLPTKPMTVPRLELQAAVLAVNMAITLRKELTYPALKTHYWTDSMVVLGYIANSTKRFHVYVANRVEYIRSHTTPGQWRHVLTDANPADISSRGVDVRDLKQSELWWSGPDMLRRELPAEGAHELSEDDPEIKKQARVYQTAKAQPHLFDLLAEGDITWNQLKRRVAYWRRFVLYLKLKAKKDKTYSEICYMNCSLLLEAEDLIIKHVQIVSYPDEYAALKAKRGYPKGHEASRTRRDKLKSTSNLYRLDVYLDDDELIHVGGRVRRANLPREFLHPKLLPKHHRITQMIVRHHHIATRHQGRGMTLGALRTAGWWLTHGKSTVAKYLTDCYTCKKIRSQPMSQKMSDLPTDRTEEAPPFTYCGVDYFGPFYVKRGRCVIKLWCCMFVCLVTRAVHVEVAKSLSTDSFLHAYRRFVHRRGPVRSLRCDRGTNFVGAAGELEGALAELNEKVVRHELQTLGCDWIGFEFNSPKSSHMGGVWERMIRSLRSVLQELLVKHGDQLDEEMLHTFLVEAESIVNSRPLTCVDSTSAEPAPLISPAQLFTLKSKHVGPMPGKFVPEDVYCRKRWRCIQYLADLFWKAWRRDYLPKLQVRSKWNDEKPQIQVNDHVLMVEEDLPRGSWPRAVVIALLGGKDGIIRRVSLRTVTSTFERPIHKVIFLYRPDAASSEPENSRK